MKCQCQEGDFCPIYNKVLTKRFWQFCQGTSGLTREKEEAYLAKLLPNSGEMPSLMKQAFNLVGSFVGHAANGFREALPEDKRIRLEICKSCDRRADDRCVECGCFIEVKAGWVSEKCPLGKWPGVAKVNGGCGSCGS